MDATETAEMVTAQAVAESPEWWYFGRNFSFPKYNNIGTNSFSDVGEFAPAWKVFETLKLDLAKLAGIYSGGSEGVPASYAELGSCPANKKDGWSQLSRLTGKVIHWIRCSGKEPGGPWVAIYYPDGRIE